MSLGLGDNPDLSLANARKKLRSKRASLPITSIYWKISQQ
ncbi:hypothetical protein ACQ5UC_10385 [Vibrio cholerae]